MAGKHIKHYKISSFLTNPEHCHRYHCCLPSRLRRCSRRSPSILRLGLQGPQRPAPQRRHRSMDRCRHCDLHASSIERGFHIARLSGRCSQCRGIRSHLSGSIALYPEAIPQAAMEPWSLEQAIPVHWSLLEWMGRGCAVFAVSMACHWG